MEKIKVKIKLMRPAAKVPEYATQGSAGCDLSACIDEPYELAVGEIHSFPTGIAIAGEDDGLVGLVFGRSGLGRKYGITMANSVGVIDSDYRGEIQVTLINRGENPYTVNPGDRVAQLVIVPCYAADFCVSDELEQTVRGEGGFGSTGL